MNGWMLHELNPSVSLADLKLIYDGCILDDLNDMLAGLTYRKAYSHTNTLHHLGR